MEFKSAHSNTTAKLPILKLDVLEIFMQQFWYTIKKVQDIDSYEFLLANKKCIVNAEVFRTILDICPRVKGVDFLDVPDDDTTLTFLIDLGYKGEDYQEYGLPIPDVMLTDAIKRSESYQMFIKYSTNEIPPKKSRGKGSKGKKTVKESQETIDVSEEAKPKPEPATKKTSGKRRVKKKVKLSADDNIISDDLDAALELAKSISQTKAEEAEAEAARKVHATHARIVTESVPESTKMKSSGRSSKSVVIQDTPSTPKSKPTTSKTKLKGAPSFTPQEHEAVDMMQALKERVPDESIVVSATSSEGTGAKPRVPNKEKDITEEKVILEWGDEQDSDDHANDTQDVDDEDVETKSDEDEIYKYRICVYKDEDVEMKDAKVEESDKGEEKVTDAEKEEIEKTSKAKDDTNNTELPPSSSSLSVSSGFGDQFLKLSSDSSLVIAKLEKDVAEMKTVDHSSEAIVVLQFQVPTVVDSYLDTKDGDVFQKEMQKHTANLIHKYSLQYLPEFTMKPTPTVEQESENSPLDIVTPHPTYVGLRSGISNWMLLNSTIYQDNRKRPKRDV
ncbi:hypothetical protein Tco_1088044 [Tanacetum coccineum]